MTLLFTRERSSAATSAFADRKTGKEPRRVDRHPSNGRAEAMNMWRPGSGYPRDPLATAVAAKPSASIERADDQAPSRVVVQSSKYELIDRSRACHGVGGEIAPAGTVTLRARVVSTPRRRPDLMTSSDLVASDARRQSEWIVGSNAWQTMSLDESQESAIEGLVRDLVGEAERHDAAEAICLEVSIQIARDNRSVPTEKPSSPLLTGAELARIKNHIDNHIGHPIELAD
jgi:hypothetical protein